MIAALAARVEQTVTAFLWSRLQPYVQATITNRLILFSETSRPAEATLVPVGVARSLAAGTPRSGRVHGDPTMHPRKTGYNDLETLNLLNQLRSFMNELASVIPARVAMNKASSVPTPSIATLPSA
jgi:hypothetical protein